MSHTVIGVFDNQSEAQAAVAQLMSNGFTREYIDVAGQGAGSTTNAFDTSHSNDSVGDKVGNFFGSLFNNHDDAHSYSQVARQGITVTVHARSAEEATRAAALLDQYGAVDLDERASQYRSGATSMTDATTSGSASLPVIEEELQVGKRVVETGGVRLRSRIVETPVEEHLRLREEHVHVERNPVNRDATAADFNNFREGTIELTQHAEVPVVGKEVRVVEEVRLEKEVEERQEVVRDTLRSTDVEVENLGTTGTTGTVLDSDVNRSSNFSSDADRGGDFSSTLSGSGAGLAGAGVAAGAAGLGGLNNDNEDFLNRSSQDWSGTNLRRMSDIKKDYEVADDHEDVMDWDVVGRDGTKIGEVEDMIVDMQAMKVRYLEVELDDDLPGVQDDHRVLIPVGIADLDYSNKNVLVSSLDSSMATSFPSYRGEPITRDYENTLMSSFSPGYQAGVAQDTSFYDHEHFQRRNTNRGGIL
jgi:stress response protein YsnF